MMGWMAPLRHLGAKVCWLSETTSPTRPVRTKAFGGSGPDIAQAALRADRTTMRDNANFFAACPRADRLNKGKLLGA